MDTPRTATRSENLITALCATWLILGLFVDGWAHNNLAELETFWTPWHGLFYSGFGVTAGWLVMLIRRRGGRTLRASVPPGYGLAVLGLVVFAFGGVGDAIWHSVFGVETSIDALLSPTHLLLFVGIVLIVSAPMRSISAASPGRSIDRQAFLPYAISATLLTLIVAFFFMYAWAPSSGAAAVEYVPNGAGEFEAVFGVMEIMLTTILVSAAVLSVAGRWDTPAGTFTFMLGVIGLLFAGMLDEFNQPWEVLGPLAGGATADVVAARYRPLRSGSPSWYLIGGAVPAAMWSVHILTFAVFGNVGWTPELWAGAIGMASLVGVAMAHLIGSAPERSVSEAALGEVQHPVPA